MHWGRGGEIERDVDVDRRCSTDTAIAVVQAQGHRAGRGRGVVGGGVGQVLDQAFDRLRRGRRIETHRQVAAIGATGHGADGDAAVADRIAADTDLTWGIPDMADTELIGRFPVFHVKQLKAAAAEVARVGINQADCRIEDLRRAEDHGLGKAYGGRQVAQYRRRAGARKSGRIAEQALEDLVGVVAAIVGATVARVRHHEVAIAEVGYRRMVLLATDDRTARTDLAFCVDRLTAGIVFADIGVVVSAGAADVVVIVMPGDDKTAGRQTGNVSLVLSRGRGFVDAEFCADRAAVGSETLAEHAPTAAVLGAVGPHHDIAAIG